MGRVGWWCKASHSHPVHSLWIAYVDVTALQHYRQRPRDTEGERSLFPETGALSVISTYVSRSPGWVGGFAQPPGLVSAMHS